ncbi:hypothetical protein [Vibrio splendidus]|uniref:hypothetical protein n=1 Tax=Vibrio splendidus TaxID=29497 RepID=UPI000C855C6D|nr:hypothetical protein [Vibrio splendidus]PMN25912.1 hypothetical protein BCT36_11185 [Vibrio splendidus]
MSNQEKYYYPINKQTKEVLEPVEAVYRGGVFHIPNDALQSKPLEPKDGFAVIAVLDEFGKAIYSDYIEDHRGLVIYDQQDCSKSETVTELGEIKEGFTLDKPTTAFDEWNGTAWVTNQSNKYIAEYNQVDNARRAAYQNVSDPLYMEALRKEARGLTDDAADFRNQADAAVELIKAEFPWPTQVEVS